MDEKNENVVRNLTSALADGRSVSAGFQKLNWLLGIGAPSISAECRAQGRPGRTGSWDISRAEPAAKQVMEQPSDSRYSTPSSAVTAR
ncbi:uncharacterized, partial [Tachysurus ichikawai]